MKLNLLLAAFISATFLNAADIEKEDLINKLLPNDSVVKLIHNKVPRKTAWFGSDRNMRVACDAIESTLKQLFEDLECYKKTHYLPQYPYVQYPIYTSCSDVSDYSLHWGFQEYFAHTFQKQIQSLTNNMDLTLEEFQFINRIINSALTQLKEIDRSYKEISKTEREKKQAESAAAARAAILAQYNK